MKYLGVLLLTFFTIQTHARNQDTYFFPAAKLSDSAQAAYITTLFDSMKMTNSVAVSSARTLNEKRVKLCLSNLTLRSWLDVVDKNRELFGKEYADQLYITPTKQQIEENKKQIGMSCNKAFDQQLLEIENRYKK